MWEGLVTELTPSLPPPRHFLPSGVREDGRWLKVWIFRVLDLLDLSWGPLGPRPLASTIHKRSVSDTTTWGPSNVDQPISRTSNLEIRLRRKASKVTEVSLGWLLDLFQCRRHFFSTLTKTAKKQRTLTTTFCLYWVRVNMSLLKLRPSPKREGLVFYCSLLTLIHDLFGNEDVWPYPTNTYDLLR